MAQQKDAATAHRERVAEISRQRKAELKKKKHAKDLEKLREEQNDHFKRFSLEEI